MTGYSNVAVSKEIIADMMDFRDEVIPYVRDRYDETFCELFEVLPKGPFAGWLIRFAMKQIRKEMGEE